jgi:hypothetical protein
MSSKRLKKTVIEGGRSSYNKYERRESSKNLRAKNRDHNNKVKKLLDTEEAPPAPKRKPVRKDFRDKLSPVHRWVDKQVGKSWDKVFSDICKKYDTRNLASRHIIYDHILSDIHGTGFRQFSFLKPEYYRWYIDDDGILCKGYEHKHRYTGVYQDSPEWKKRADAFHREKMTQQFGDKCIEKHGQKYYWAHPVYMSRTIPATPFKAAITDRWISHYTRGDRVSVEDKRFIFKRGIEAVKNWIIK